MNKKMKNLLKKITSSILLLSIFTLPTLINAFDTSLIGSTTASTNYVPPAGAYNPSDPWGSVGGTNNPNLLNSSSDNASMQRNVDSQINTSIRTTSTGSSSSAQNNQAAGSLGQVAGCGAGQILASMIAGSVNKAVGTGLNKAISAVDSIVFIPVSEKGLVGENIKTQTAASVGTVVGTGGISAMTAPSWDAVAYCIVNAMISYIADSTIRWINTGFEGNPAFLNNPEMFFKQLADEETASFVQNLAYGVTGTNVCDVFRANMVQSILSQYSNQGYGYGGYGYDTGGYNRGISNGFLGCSFDQNPNQLNSFIRGNFIQGGGWDSWYQISQTNQNNPYATYFRTNDQLRNQLVTVEANQNRELGWNNGWLNYKQCKNPKDKSTCVTVTPGSVIENQLESTLNISKQRLALAEKFDQVVTVLVNKLISTALNQAISNFPQ